MYLAKRMTRSMNARLLITLLVATVLVVSAAPASAVTPEEGQLDPESDINQWLQEHGFHDGWDNLSAEREGPCDQMMFLQDPCPDLELDDMVEWATTYPEKAKTGNLLTYTGWLQNRMTVPLLVTLEYSLANTQVCSISQFTTGSTTPELEPNTFVLGPRGVEEDVNGLAGISDTVTFQLNGVAEVPGDCEISVMAVVSSVGMAVGTHTMKTKVNLPLSSTANMGTVTFNCSLETITDVSSDRTVAAGEVDFKLEGLWAEPCGGSKASWLGFAGVVVDTEEEDGTEVPIFSPSVSVAAAADPEVNTASIDLDEGTHEFEVQAYIIKTGWGDKWTCWLAIAAVLVALGMITAATGGLVLGLAILGAAIAIGYLFTGICDFVIEEHSYTVTVTADEEESLAVRGIPDISECVGQETQLSDDCVPELPDLGDGNGADETTVRNAV